MVPTSQIISSFYLSTVVIRFPQKPRFLKTERRGGFEVLGLRGVFSKSVRAVVENFSKDVCEIFRKMFAKFFERCLRIFFLLMQRKLFLLTSGGGGGGGFARKSVPKIPKIHYFRDQSRKVLLRSNTEYGVSRFVVNTQAVTLLLPNSKVESIKSHCNYLLALPEVSVRDLSQLIGKLTASIQAIFPAPLHYRHLQHLKH